MSEKIILKGRPLASGVVEGEALVSKESLVWSHGVNPPTGKIVDVRVKICGECVRDKILVYPFGKGSTASATWILENTRCGTAPKAFLNRETELIILTGAVLSSEFYGVTFPVVDHLNQNPDEVIETGAWVKVDGDSGFVEVTKTPK